MNSEIIRKMVLATLSGTLPFAEIVGGLISSGVEYYFVDYVSLQFSFSSGEGSVVTLPLNYEGLPSVHLNFDGAALRAAIFDSQNNHQNFRQFSQRAVEAGVQGYYAFFTRKKGGIFWTPR